jgi:hypothetical protein
LVELAAMTDGTLDQEISLSQRRPTPEARPASPDRDKMIHFNIPSNENARASSRRNNMAT